MRGRGPNAHIWRTTRLDSSFATRPKRTSPAAFALGALTRTRSEESVEGKVTPLEVFADGVLDLETRGRALIRAA